ncbi:hypothetical protein BDV95DRAFT_565318 [Massariosphaeria phaeospora]|uniref:Uncharacterized protein n=1 Tax=Massariosphaeria phaeospora TaxID=100035 RepID=A0A7C8MBI6_9PLEO|nr:hypothetical protein BDV95DRAFT_565318 [Massariosphaeria phaeospora]
MRFRSTSQPVKPCLSPYSVAHYKFLNGTDKAVRDEHLLNRAHDSRLISPEATYAGVHRL